MSTAAAAATALGLGLSSGIAAAAVSPGVTGPGWQVNTTLAGTSGAPGPDLQGLAAVSPKDAWVSGTTVSAMYIAHWNGTSWKQVHTPSALTEYGSGGVNDSGIAASSDTNMWTFPQLSNGSKTTQYALHYNGSKWRKYWLKHQVGSVAVLSPADVWAVGDGGAYRFNGNAWRWVSTPRLYFPALNALSAHNIWLTGITSATINAASPTVEAAHWTGGKWHTMKVAALSLDGQPAIVQATTPAGRDLWTVEGFPANRGSGTAPPGILITRWNGHHWSRVLSNGTYYAQSALTSDGHGGFWLVAYSPKSGVDSLLHYSGGKLTRTTIPTKPGYTSGQLGNLTQVPGTRSMWGTGGLTPTGSQQAETAIFGYDS